MPRKARKIKVDTKLLANVETARAALELSEYRMRKHRGEFHAAVGQLSRSGLTVRALGKVLDFSFQRIQQMVEELICGFCGARKNDAARLFPGGAERSYICDKCVALASKALRTKHTAEDDRISIQYTASARDACDYCGCKIGQPHKDPPFRKLEAFAIRKSARICRQCAGEFADTLASERKGAKRARA